MPRARKPSFTTLAMVRRYFNLEQEELALYLGVSRGMVAHLEAGRRAVSEAVFLRLLPLSTQLGERQGAGAEGHFINNATAAAELPPEHPLPAFAPLDARRDYCAHTAGQLWRAVRPFVARARYAARWQAALPRLLAALPPLSPDPPAPPAGSVEAVRAALLRQWLPCRVEVAELTAEEMAEWHLLRLRAEALEAEAAALTALLAGRT
ncbi:MAG: helix-turn-helix transcriptional regulator [Hymenobacteraceae bacterium]|nr:helix-turn-helix transcriptional regulator [Hymenobacteraceae bacterium]